MAPSVDDTVPTKSKGLEALSQGTTLPGIPKFSSYDKQRAYMLNHMAGAFRVFARHGFVEGMAGHISLRDPEFPDRFWTNPYALAICSKYVDKNYAKNDDTLQAWPSFRTDNRIGPDPSRRIRNRRGRQYI